jgi:hypothetical protein
MDESTESMEIQSYKRMQTDQNARCAFILTADAVRYEVLN